MTEAVTIAYVKRDSRQHVVHPHKEGTFLPLQLNAVVPSLMADRPILLPYETSLFLLHAAMLRATHDSDHG